MKKNRQGSTFERLMKNKVRKKNFEKKYKEFLLSELVIKFMKEADISVRKLAEEVGVSSSVIQDIRSGTRDNVTLKTFFGILAALDAEVTIKKGKHIVRA